MTQRNKNRPDLKLFRRQAGFQGLAAFLTALLLFCLSAMTPSGKAYGCSRDLIRQSIQEQTDAGKEKDIHSLEQGKPIRRELAGGQRHAFRIRLAADQFLKAVLEQEGIYLEVSLLGPDGKPIMKIDSEGGQHGHTTITLLAESEGDYRLVVQPLLKQATAGAYELQIEELRAPTENERALQEARKLFDNARPLLRAGKYDEAIPLVERTLKTREAMLGPDHRDVASALNRLAVLYWNKSAYVKAEPLYKRSLAILEKVFGQEHPIVANSLNNLALLYKDKGDYSKAEPLFQRALSLWMKFLGQDHTAVAVGIENLAELYFERGEYAKAEPLYKRGLAIWEKALGPDAPDFAISLYNLGTLLYTIGDYAKAEPLLQRALNIGEKALGPDHPDVANTLSSLGILRRNKGDYAKAEQQLQRALDIRQKALGPEHPDVAMSIHQLALLYSSKGAGAKAEPLYQQALSIWEKALGPDHPDVGVSLNDLANFYRYIGNYSKAEPLYQRALAIREKSLGPKHPHLAESLNDIARFFVTKGDTLQAIAFQSRANAISEHNLAHNLVIGSERRKLAYLAMLSAQTDRTISLHLRYAPDDPAPGVLASTLILQRKGRALDATSHNLNALRGRFNAEDQALLDRLTETRSQIARLVLRGPQKMTAEQHRDLIKELEDQAEKDEAEISRSSDEFRVQYLPVTLEAVRAAIPPDSALIEFASYRPFNAKAANGEEVYGQARYVAYVLRSEGEIGWKELGEAKSIDAAITALRKALRDPKRADVKRLARVVDAKVFQPLRPLLGDMTRLLISPDGSLNLVPFAALVDEKGRYAVERYSISFLTSGRDLLRLQTPRESRGGPLVVAAPDFGRRSPVEASRLEKQEKDATQGEINAESTRSAIQEFYFPPLPYAAQEGEALQELLPDATLLTKGQATKAALGQVRSPELLHIATHSFFLEDQQLTLAGERGAQAPTDPPESALQRIEGRSVRIESPLLRSGLALAGANEHKEADNGILTALEVTGLNLWGTKLVALSACDTGVGEVKNGDGVHGLRRALVLAGAETQVMSLWAVSDKATRELMVAYYGRLKQGQGRGEALRRVQLEMLKNVNRRHPYYWASFIQSGEWANLEGKR
jgi:CHAT domain-containing protein/Tfp pilus assembly protein PilF